MSEHRINSTTNRCGRGNRGFSLIELLIVVVLIAILTAVAVPLMVSSKRLNRSAGIPREVVTQLRFARQHAMSQRKAVTFQWDDTNKRILIILHNDIGPDTKPNTDDDIKSGKEVLTSDGYPLTSGYTIVRTISLGGFGVPADDIVCGVQVPLLPSTTVAPTSLGDGTSMTTVSSSQINITFQPDGSVIDSAGAPKDFAIFLHNAQVPKKTASAISVLGAAGRIKFWRYNEGTNVYDE
jgi:prepilin-type N-terminal cleavage/methylation domain-containing protein